MITGKNMKYIRAIVLQSIHLPTIIQKFYFNMNIYRLDYTSTFVSNLKHHGSLYQFINNA